MSITKFQFERFEQEKQRLASLRKYEAVLPEYDEDLDKLVKMAAFICQAPISLVNLVEANQTIFAASIGTDLKGSSREISFCSKAIISTGVFEVPDAKQDERFRNNPLVTGDSQIRFYAGSPLVNKEGMNMGTLCVFDQKPKVLNTLQRESLETLGNMAMMVMEVRKQAAVLQKGNLPAVISLQNKVSELTKPLESVLKFLPVEVASELMPKNMPPQSFTLSKDMVLLQCRVHVQVHETSTNISLLHKIYELITNVVLTFNGIIHHFDGNDISAFFSEPLDSFPYDKNALYCAFELTQQFDKLLQNENISASVHLTTCMHSGQVESGLISLPNRIDYTISGKVVEESKLIRNVVITKGSAVVISNPYFEKVKSVVEFVKRYTVNEQDMHLDMYEVELAKP